MTERNTDPEHGIIASNIPNRIKLFGHNYSFLKSVVLFEISVDGQIAETQLFYV
jgi:hypothetical protein